LKEYKLSRKAQGGNEMRRNDWLLMAVAALVIIALLVVVVILIPELRVRQAEVRPAEARVEVTRQAPAIEVTRQVVVTTTPEPTSKKVVTPTLSAEERSATALEQLVELARVERSVVEGVPIPQEVMTVITATITDIVYTDPEVFWASVYRPCPAGSTCLPLERKEVAGCVGETNCLTAGREKNLEGVVPYPYYGCNPTACIQDGWMVSAADRLALGRKSPAGAVGSGVPSGYCGLLEGLTLRPCSSY
jgi:flagellar basal body-associated protein FliL